MRFGSCITSTILYQSLGIKRIKDPPLPLSPTTTTMATQQPGNEIVEVDPSFLQDPSSESYDRSGYDTSTASLSSSIQQYVFENGRRYHAYFGVDKNPLPTDEKEQDRMDLHHEMFLKLLDGRLHLAPIKNPHRILDVGTGTGIWAIDMADKYSQAEVIGNDLRYLFLAVCGRLLG
jgi:2-polyprenyl-3-methyl-5-hydroxy-6-metoxy-1,4-benzoquinol methylase